jgi:hypothetical protein
MNEIVAQGASEKANLTGVLIATVRRSGETHTPDSGRAYRHQEKFGVAGDARIIPIFISPCGPAARAQGLRTG